MNKRELIHVDLACEDPKCGLSNPDHWRSVPLPGEMDDDDEAVECLRAVEIELREQAHVRHQDYIRRVKQGDDDE